MPARDAMAHAAHQRRVAKGQVLAWEGDRSDMVVSVRSGIIALTATSPEGNDHIVALTGPGGFIGPEGGLAMAFNLVALTDADICRFSRNEFEAMMEAQPELRRNVMARIGRDLARSRGWMVKLGRASAAARVAALLVEFAEAAPGGADIAFPLSRGQMADFAGLTIETVSRQLTRLREQAIISLSRTHFEVLDWAALRDLADLPPPRADNLLH
ncbi:MAG: Crp/Fnr family transcriptional regulator [Sphingobium sp.]|nr:Crp/Fnr family transcriptional regulator [Sphingobium sp.]